MRSRYCYKTCMLLLSFSLSLLFCINNGYAKTQSGLILSGMDTLFDDAQHNGMDFVLQRPCTSATLDPGCNAHFGFDFITDAYFTALAGQGRALDMGKQNLDSIKSAPPESQMNSELVPGYRYSIFKIIPDSLRKCIGNCYILETGIDPRPTLKVHFYAKFKILKFNAVDSINHYFKMVFLWAYNSDALHDLTTSGLDTFHLETPTLSQSEGNLLRNEKYASMNQHAFKVLENDFRLPQTFLGKAKSFSIWNSQGRKLAQIRLNKTNLLIQMPKDLKGKGIFIVKADITK
jgi:hypothetical protein